MRLACDLAMRSPLTCQRRITSWSPWSTRRFASARASRSDCVAVRKEYRWKTGSSGRLGFIVTVQHKSRRCMRIS